MSLRSAVRTHVGLVRDGNEDSAYAGPRLVAVADGMGGHAAGEVASRVAIESVAGLDTGGDGNAELHEVLSAAVRQAQDAIRARASRDTSAEGMGTTLTALLWTGTDLGLVHIGDSRAYLLRDGEFRQITRDHTYVQELVDAGRITAAEAGTHPQRSLITRALDGRDDPRPDVEVRGVRLGDRYLLCSDGLSEAVPDEAIGTALSHGDPAAAADRLVDLALEGGGPDNVTVIVTDVVPEERPDAPVRAGAALLEHTAEHATLEPEGGSVRRTTSAAPPARRLRRIVVGLAVVVLVLAAAGGGWLWIRSQYYVGMAEGQVAIFRGVAGSVGGVALSGVVERPGIATDGLGSYEVSRLRDGITAADLGRARRIADRLRQCTTASSPPGTPSADSSCPAS